MRYSLLHYDSKDKQQWYPPGGYVEKSISFVKLKLRRTRYRILLAVILVANLAYWGILTKMLQKSFDDFEYPVDHPHFRELIEAIKVRRMMHHHFAGSSVDFKPLYNRTEFDFPMNPFSKCQSSQNVSSGVENPVAMLLVVKSAACNYHLRNAIRQTWGNENRFIDFNIRTVFMIGQCNSESCPVHPSSHSSYSSFPYLKAPTWIGKVMMRQSDASDRISCEESLSEEFSRHGDLVQGNFIDSYYNNTLKTIATLQWVSTNCDKVPFSLFVDDDYFVSIRNLIRFTHDFLRSQTDVTNNEVNFDGRLYAGWVYPNSSPMRHWSSKWYISLEQYPFNRYPPYITGGCFLLNNRTVDDLYHASLYTLRFAFDDVYLGILAKKMHMNLIHTANMTCVRKDPRKLSNLISSHGFDDPEEMAEIWFHQKSLNLV